MPEESNGKQQHPTTESLNQACRILTDARVEVVNYASRLPWLLLEHARLHLAKQADELLHPIFSPHNFLNHRCTTCDQREHEADRNCKGYSNAQHELYLQAGAYE